MNPIKMIRAAEAKRDGANITRFYNIVNPIRNGEFRLDTYAVKRGTKAEGLCIKKVVKIWSDRDQYEARDLLKNWCMNTISVNWADHKWGRRCGYDAYLNNEVGMWATHMWETRDKWIVWGMWLNGLEGTRYEKCGYDPSAMPVKDYLAVWDVSHSVEFLSKAGFKLLITKAFVKRLRDDRDLFMTFRNRVREMDGRTTIGEVMYAHRHGVDMKTARDKVWEEKQFRQHVRGIVFPRNLKIEWKREAFANIGYALGQFMQDANYLGIVLKDIPPPSIHTAEAIARQAKNRREKEDIERRDAEIRHIKRICGYMEGITFGGKELRILQTQAEYIAEGRFMRNCIGTVYRADDKSNIIVSVRENGVSVADIRLDSNSFEIMEARMRFNEVATSEIKTIAYELSDQLKARCA